MANFAFLLLLFPLLASAEYRVFTLHIIDSTAKSTRQVETTLDPDQYKSLYPIRATEQITYIETWRCRGNTSSFKAHCDNPDRNPASPEISPEVKALN